MRSWRWLAGVGVALLPAAIYLTVIAATSVNIPRGDDYEALLQFLCEWRGTSTFADTLHRL
jgi:hypothetical protein